jgi:hypothetical protein
MSQEKQTAEEIESLRKDIIERTAKNIPTKVHEDYIKLQIRIALNNYAVPFEKKLQEQAKEIERLKGENEFFKRMIRRKEQLSKNSDMDFGVGDLD